MTGAAAADESDPLASMRRAFALPPQTAYFVGHSLGPPRRGAAERAAQFVDAQWRAHLVRGWNECGWMRAPFELGDQIGALIGAAPGQVVVGDTTTLQLYRAIGAALSLRPERDVVLVEADNFPADNYIAQGIVDRFGGKLRLVAVLGQALETALDEHGDRVAVVAASHVNYRSAAVLDLDRITSLAHQHGALVCFDLAHSVGVIDARLDACGCDFAVGCTYKYLSGGPGAPAFLYVAERHHGRARSPTRGWLGHARPFAMEAEHEAAPGIEGFLCGTPRIVSLDAMAFAIEPLRGLDMRQVRAKSMALTQRLIDALAPWLEGDDAPLTLVSPSNAEQRGAHVAFAHPAAHEIVRALEARGLLGDFRAPDVMRFGLAPMTTRHVDVARLAQGIDELLRSGAWDDDAFRSRRPVT